MRYMLQTAAILSDIIVLAMVALLWYSGGKQSPISCLILTALGFWAWHDSGGFIAWTPSGIHAFFRNSKHLGL